MNRRATVLWCDDDPLVLGAAKRAVRDIGFEVDFVGAAADAQIALASKHHRVLVADLRMPIMSGLELCRWARVWSPTVRCILCTAYPEDLRSVDTTGIIDALVAKPFDIATMRSAILEQMAFHKRSDPSFPITICNDEELARARQAAAGAVQAMRLSVAPDRSSEPPR